MDIGDVVGGGMILLFIGILLGILVVGVIDLIYKEPLAADKANEMCKEQGYDSYEKFSRIGLWSTEPVAIRCKYVDNYKDIDMNINRDVTTLE